MAAAVPARPSTSSPFVVALCRPGFESAVVTELEGYGLRMSFRRPGFVSFKTNRPFTANDVRDLSMIFPRRLGLTVGAIADEADAVARAMTLAAEVGGRVRVLAREGLLGEDPASLVDDSARRLQRVLDRQHPPPGDPRAPLIEIIRVEGTGNDDDSSNRYVVIKAITGLLDCAGGTPDITVPPESPSRAFRKLEDAVHRFGLDLGAGDIAVEVGAAPGGVTLALLRRGLQVTAIDQNAIDESVLSSGPVRHLRIAVEKIDLKWLPPATFLFLDVTQPPRSAMAMLAPVADALLPTLRSAVLTLKLGDRITLDEIPHWHGIIRRMFPGFAIEMAQLPSNKSEISVGLIRRR